MEQKPSGMSRIKALREELEPYIAKWEQALIDDPYTRAHKHDALMYIQAWKDTLARGVFVSVQGPRDMPLVTRYYVAEDGRTMSELVCTASAEWGDKIAAALEAYRDEE